MLSEEECPRRAVAQDGIAQRVNLSFELGGVKCSERKQFVCEKLRKILYPSAREARSEVGLQKSFLKRGEVERPLRFIEPEEQQVRSEREPDGDVGKDACIGPQHQ